MSSEMTFTHSELVEVGRRWLLRPWRNAGEGHSACCLVLTEIVTGAGETPDVIGWNGYSSILLECKVSRSDFKADAGKYFRREPERGMGRQRYYVAPVGVLEESEIPEGWGFIEVDSKKATRVRRASSMFEPDLRCEIAVLLSLLRRLKCPKGLHVAIRAYEHMIKNPKATVTFARTETGRGRKPAEEEG